MALSEIAAVASNPVTTTAVTVATTAVTVATATLFVHSADVVRVELPLQCEVRIFK
jgi:hypothetical protein